MLENSRRTFMKYTGIAAASIGSAGTVSAQSNLDQAPAETARGSLNLLGHAFLDNPPGIYTQGSIRTDGMYGVMGGYYGEGGSFLVDLEDLENPTQAHRLPSAMTTRHNDVKFADYDDGGGLYFRTQEPNIEGGEGGFEIIDYGHAEGAPDDPVIRSRVEREPNGIHNLWSHYAEPVLYLTSNDPEQGAVEVWDVSDPDNPTPAEPQFVGPEGSHAHDVEVDPVRDVLHVAVISGDFEGYLILDIDNPLQPEELGRFDYTDQPEYEEIGTPGFEGCHKAMADPERDIAIIGDEVGSGMPGGKHFFDIGWEDGSLEEPVHIGFTHSPNATEQGEDEPFFWTTHMHDVVPESATDDGSTLLVDGGYHEGVWVCDITDPRNPIPSQQFQTREDEEVAEALGSGPIVDFLDPLHSPFVWSARYNSERDFVFASDTLTGAYVFEVSADKFEFRTIEEEIRQSFEPEDEIGERGLELARHYCETHASVPNTGGQSLNPGLIRRFEQTVEEEDAEEDDDNNNHGD